MMTSSFYCSALAYKPLATQSVLTLWGNIQQASNHNCCPEEILNIFPSNTIMLVHNLLAIIMFVGKYLSIKYEFYSCKSSFELFRITFRPSKEG